LNNVTILTEVGKDIGYGHYTRCSSLYQALTNFGNQVRFLVYENEYVLNDSKIQSLNWLKSIHSISPISANEIVIIDSYLAVENTYKQLAERFYKVIVIDDYNRIRYPVDIVINPNVFFEKIDYSNQSAVCIGGKDYVILRPEFRSTKPIKYEKYTSLRLLITIGGSDFRKLLLTLINCFLEIPDLLLTVIDPERSLTQENNKQLRILPSQTATEMVNEIQMADIVVSACGQTLHELAVLSKPTIGICLDIDQAPNQQFYVAHDFLKKEINWNDKDLLKKLYESLSHFSIPENRNHTKQTTHLLINKNGVRNVVNLLKSKSNEAST